MQDHGVMMDIYNSLEEILNIEPTVTALGNFDGVHKGHRELIERAVRMSKEMGIKSAVFTFSNHPKNLLTGSLSVKNILYPEDKAKIIDPPSDWAPASAPEPTRMRPSAPGRSRAHIEDRKSVV